MGQLSFFLLSCLVFSLVAAVPSRRYKWNNVKIGGGGGFVPGIVFNPKEKGLAYCRTDIGGAYRLNSDDTWTPLLDFADHERWNYWGVDALATDPFEPHRLYLATGMYTNSWDPNNGQILRSVDRGRSWETPSKLPFKVGGNMPGRGMGERLVVDPNRNSIVYFGARSGNGLWKSTDYGVTWANVTNFPSVGTFIPIPGDSNDYNTDIVGISWITFDHTSGASGKATPRIFVGVANKGSNNVFVSEDAGATWTAVAGQNNQYLPHKGVLSPSEKALYLSYSDGAGPYDGASGALYKYSIANKTWTNITPVSGADLTHGFGGVAVDLQRPGTIMVAALNSWWPDGLIFRSTNGGQTWTRIWEWVAYPEWNKYYSYSNSLAPWLGPNYVEKNPGTLQVGWMMEALVIDPHDSNHWLYGTGATIYGGRDLLQWDVKRNVTIQSLADGVEETSILGLASPPSGPPLLSAVGDIGGFVHSSLNAAPAHDFQNPKFTSTADIDFAGKKPNIFVRVATDSANGQPLAVSSTSGSTWYAHPGIPSGAGGGKVAISADGDTILWKTQQSSVLVSRGNTTFAAVSTLPGDAVIAADKVTNANFYAASGSTFFVSTDGGATFSRKGSLGSSTAPFEIAVHPSKSSDIWVTTNKGLFYSSNSGTSFTQIPGITEAWGVALGAPASSTAYPSIFVAANIDGAVAYIRSDNTGAAWVKINDGYGFGSASANVITADARVHGRVYVGTNGRGIFYGDAA
ncbi:hypothetical protein BKA70DRAFT_649198 [Coprinopsis sp. MPI-PUGE-AT-0042]|nr:hypothetical protein BKA70DRAFT_649198 [Coprinopsis sp. MPI-PUGE-AT-0042]